MKITIVTLSRAGSPHRYVTAIRGLISVEDRLKLAEEFRLTASDKGEDKLNFCECQLCDDVIEASNVASVNSSGTISATDI